MEAAVAFASGNQRFWTNAAKGYPYEPGKPGGSVFKEPLANDDGQTLWLEHVWDDKLKKETFWLMWYNNVGQPALSVSGVINADKIEEIGRRLISLRESDNTDRP
jgi:hypothetical protein